MEERAWEGVRSGQFMHPGCCHKLWQTAGPGQKVPQGLCFSPRFFGSFLKSNFQQRGTLQCFSSAFPSKAITKPGLPLLCEVHQGNTARNFTDMLQHKTWMFILRLKATLFMGEEIPVQFLRLLPYNLYLFAIHQTPSSLCISRLLIYRVCSVCSKQQEEGAEIGFYQ